VGLVAIAIILYLFNRRQHHELHQGPGRTGTGRPDRRRRGALHPQSQITARRGPAWRSLAGDGEAFFFRGAGPARGPRPRPSAARR
jgi:hypothetical protein